jgi:hypothetical protein
MVAGVAAISFSRLVLEELWCALRSLSSETPTLVRVTAPCPGRLPLRPMNRISVPYVTRRDAEKPGIMALKFGKDLVEERELVGLPPRLDVA